MSLVFSPDDYTVNELTQFTQVVSVTEDIIVEPIPVVQILTATTDDSGVTVTHNDTSFTMTGSFVEAFSRTLTYMDNKLNTITATSFSDIPNGFSTLQTYVAPTAAQVIRYVELTFSNHSPVSYQITVENDFAAANAALTAKVSEGKF